MNYTNCPHCGGRLRYESLGWICEKCRGFIDMQGNFHEHVEKPFMPPMTNGDLIRRMTDEELAVFLNSIEVCENQALEKCRMADHAFCVACTLRWLQQPAEVQEK